MKEEVDEFEKVEGDPEMAEEEVSKPRIIISHFVCYKKQVNAGAITSSNF